MSGAENVTTRPFNGTHLDLKASSIAKYVQIFESKGWSGEWIFRGQAEGWPPIPVLDRDAALRRRGRVGLPFVEGRSSFERAILEEFRSRARALVNPWPQDEWEVLALARHHGVPTRLLDWTEDALAALYFAVEDADADGADSVVYGYRQIAMPRRYVGGEAFTESPGYNLAEGPLGAPTLIVYVPPHIDARITAQSAMFTSHPAVQGPQDWPAFYQATGHCATIRIPSDARRRIRSALHRQGLHWARFFPDLDGIGAHLCKRFLAEPWEPGSWVTSSVEPIEAATDTKGPRVKEGRE